MKTILFAVFSFFVTTAISAQTTDTIEIRKGSQFYYMGKRLKPGKVTEMISGMPEAAATIKKANSNLTVGTILGSVGGFLIGYPLGAAIGGDKMNWAVLGAGAGLSAISIPFYSAYGKHAKTAVAAYNGKHYSNTSFAPQVRFGVNTNGLGLQLRF